MGGGASTAILHGCHPQNTCGNALHDECAYPAATARVNVRLGRERSCVGENGTAAAAKTLSTQGKKDDSDALPCQRLEQQCASLPNGGSTVGIFGQDGVDSPSTVYSDVDDPSSTSNQTIEGATKIAGKEDENAKCCGTDNDDSGPMTKEEAEKWLNSQPMSPTSCSTTEEVKCPAGATVVDLPRRVSGGGSNRPSSSIRQPTPVRSRRGSDTAVEAKLGHDNGEEGSRSHEASTNVPRGDGKPCSDLSILTSLPSSSGAKDLSRAPNAHCCPTNGVRTNETRKPRRDSFSASLQAARKTSSLTTARQLFRTRHAGGDDRSRPASTTHAVNGPELQLPRDQQRHSVFLNMPTTAFATLLKTNEQLPRRTLQEGSPSEEGVTTTRANTDAKEPRHRLPPPCLETDQTSPCSSGMDDEEWLKVSLQNQTIKGVTMSKFL